MLNSHNKQSTTNKMINILYIHPYSHYAIYEIPLGIIANVNLLQQNVIGKYAEEVNEADILSADMILLDIHWFFALAPISAIIREIRKYKPEVVIVAGGITADMFKYQLMEKFDIDYILFGDTEQAFLELVQHISSSAKIPETANVLTRNDLQKQPEKALTKRIDEETFNRLDWLNIDWFQTAKKHYTESDFSYPLIIPTRGCKKNCSFCYGSHQKYTFGDDVLLQSPEKFIQSIAQVDQNPEMNKVSIIISGFLLEHYVDAIARENFDLDLNLECCGMMSDRAIHAVRKCFKGKIEIGSTPPWLISGNTDNPQNDPHYADYIEMIRKIKALDNISFKVFASLKDDSAIMDDEIREYAETVFSDDWYVTRPHQDKIANKSHFADIMKAAEKAANGYLLCNIIYNLEPNMWFPNGPDLNDPFVKKMKNIFLSNMQATRSYGFSELKLKIGIKQVDDAFTAEYLSNYEIVDGEFTIRAGLNEYTWKTELEIGNDKTLAIAPVPEITLKDKVLIFDKEEQAKLPAICLPKGQRRKIKAGGYTHPVAGRTYLWLNDNGNFLRYSIASRKTDDSGDKNKQLDRWSQTFTKENENCSQAVWRDPRLPSTLLHFLIAANQKHNNQTWKYQEHTITGSHLSLKYVSQEENELIVFIFPKVDSGKYLTTNHCSISYSVDMEEDADDMIEEIIRIIKYVEARKFPK